MTDQTPSIPAAKPAPDAQTLAGRAVLLEIGAQLGLLEPLSSTIDVSPTEAAEHAQVAVPFVADYYGALVHAGLARRTNGPDATTPRFAAAVDLADSINDAGYILWSVMSCAPMLWNAKAFASDLASAAQQFKRDGDHVARTSRWMGEADFYPQAEHAILSRRPRKLVDLGSGTCALLMRLLRKLPESRGVGIDISREACARAKASISAAGFSSRLNVVEAPIQSLLDDPTPIEGASVIHAGWVFHDLMPQEEAVLDRLLRMFRAEAPDGALVMVEGVPYGAEPGEGGFSASYTFLHSHFMGRQLQTETEWLARLGAAGYGNVEVSRLGISGGRLFVAQA
jgi:SAM-dependent methyltransferase